jgi:hypothetical protein
MKNEQSSVVFRVPDFTDSDRIEYTDIEVIVEMDGDIRDTVQFVKTLERPLAAQMKAAGDTSRRESAKRVRTAAESETQSTLAAIQEEQEEAGAAMIRTS